MCVFAKKKKQQQNFMRVVFIYFKKEQKEHSIEKANLQNTKFLDLMC